MNGKFHEIIEFPCILWKLHDNKLEYVSKFREFVQPSKNKQLSPFCINLTGISQDQVDAGKLLNEVIFLFKKWLYSLIENDADVTIITFGD